ncbi:hypothetical protein [Sinorhizobium fredii]|uniref:Uncharacterized protein n=1 Tax=Rhizobium fredii TaxID=380 RepID=A0A2L0H785_RHIFR|nr:hypothetical protein [Sinorhizobium fredii]AUX77340.1 hypothetical protein NXT3_CH02782 [Sinorhizobium fredii]
MFCGRQDIVTLPASDFRAFATALSVDDWFAAASAVPRAKARYDAGGVARKGYDGAAAVSSVKRGVRDAS